MTAKTAAALNTQADTDLAANAAGDISDSDVRTLIKDIIDSYVNSTDTPVVGKQTTWIPAGAMMPAATSGAEAADNEAATNDVNYKTLAFDDAADEYAHFNIAMPKGWNESTVTFRVFWSTTATDTDGVAWGLQGRAVSDGDAIDGAWGTAVVATDNALSAAGDVLVSVESAAVTIAGTPAEGDLCFFRIFRDVSDANDVMTEDALLIGIQLLYTTNAPTDA